MNQVKTTQRQAVRDVALARIFSPSIYKELAAKGRSPALSRLARQCTLFDQVGCGSIGDLFEYAFLRLKQGNRSEYVYKAALAKKTILGIHNLNTAALLSEYRAGSSKADIVVVNGTTTVYEVKSERDKLCRLSGQISDYLQVFGRVNVVLAAKHIADAENLLPEIVGIHCLTKRNQISVVREGQDNSNNILSSALFNSLSLREASEVLIELGIRTPSVPNTQLYTELAKIFDSLPGKIVHEASVKVLKISRSQSYLKDFISGLPSSLKVNALTTPLRIKDRSRVLETLGLPIETAKKWI
ncbi:sce7726 family protein [Marinobacter sp. M3C]|jgi:hypothetical protein|uniref:sce7726 family protein n=1 Tax=unclassified Marinobacter TaxID=83889 RepID=UPI00200BC49E|nr:MULTISPECIES: sce7726 family protein [unclassified Marinobacter]UQG54043.1 sce7726 family protein [Marinobacter sp. M4C]UQG60549.1 sce7726 family protein [Marinobacter sp. M3C]UQG62850.1 sce7726 family protein [Marinobacter sp. M2C]UQG67127.1 sce7726 family protein [Marinobacter sp. M1C]